MRNVFVLIVLLLGFAPAGSSPMLAQGNSGCTFVLGFATLHDMIPSVVGACLDDEAHNPDNGDALQHTANGLLVWRKADNFSAFTDGSRTWVNGPNGVQARLNDERFPWEANSDGLPVVAGSSGIVGDVVLGPITPVCRLGVPCNRPVAATVSVQDQSGRQVLQFTSGADGQFRVDLPPGVYTLVPTPLQPGSFFPRAVSATVTVMAGSYAHVELSYDTGIR